MFKNYLTTAIRNLLHQKFQATINIAGLAIGMTCVILIAMYVRWEVSFNTQIPDTDNLYRVIRSTVNEENEWSHNVRTPGALTGVLRDEYPEVVRVTRLFRRAAFVSVEDKAISQQFCLADNNILDTFPHTFVKGNAETLARSKNSLVISQTLAQNNQSI